MQPLQNCIGPTNRNVERYFVSRMRDLTIHFFLICLNMPPFLLSLNGTKVISHLLVIDFICGNYSKTFIYLIELGTINRFYLLSLHAI